MNEWLDWRVTIHYVHTANDVLCTWSIARLITPLKGELSGSTVQTDQWLSSISLEMTSRLMYPRSRCVRRVTYPQSRDSAHLLKFFHLNNITETAKIFQRYCCRLAGLVVFGQKTTVMVTFKRSLTLQDVWKFEFRWILRGILPKRLFGSVVV